MVADPETPDMNDKVYILSHEFGRSIYGGAGSVINAQVTELRRRGIDVEVLVWSHNSSLDMTAVRSDGALVLEHPSEFLQIIPSGALVIDHLYMDHPFRRAMTNRIQYEHGIGGWTNSTRPDPSRYEGARAVVCVSHAEAALFRRFFPAMAGLTEVVYNGSPLPHSVAPSAGGTVIGYLGRTAGHKRADFVHRVGRAAGLHTRFAFATTASPLPDWAKDPDIDVRENLTPAEQQQWFWPDIGLLCIPSSYEPFGMVAIEALSRGVPVLAARTGGLAEIITPECGFFFETDGLATDIAFANFVQALGQWQNSTAGQRYMMSMYAMDRARAFTPDIMVNGLLEIIHRRCAQTDFLLHPQP